MSVNCGLYVPTRDELARRGVKLREEHPNFGRYDDLGVAKELIAEGTPRVVASVLEAARIDRIGQKIKLPDSSPKNFPPFSPGATQRWSDRSWKTVHRIQAKVPGIVCATYQGHGRTGEKWGIDAFVSTIHEKADAAEEEAGDRLCEWAVRNWSWLNLNYLIWWNWMNDGAGWFDYEPYRAGGSGSQELVTSRHLDHLHFQIDNPYVAGNE